MTAIKPKNIVALGDSITQCVAAPEDARWTARLAFLLEGRDPGQYSVFNRGIGGNTTAMALDRFNVDVAPLLPALVLIEFGINDAYVNVGSRVPRMGVRDFENNLEEMIRRTREGGGEPCLIVNHPITDRTDLHTQGNGQSILKNMLPYNDIIRKMADRLSCKLIDQFVNFSKIKNSAELHSEDGVHLSNVGNRAYADFLFEALQLHFDQ